MINLTFKFKSGKEEFIETALGDQQWWAQYKEALNGQKMLVVPSKQIGKVYVINPQEICLVVVKDDEQVLVVENADSESEDGYSEFA
jgi:hypothetical protein